MTVPSAQFRASSHSLADIVEGLAQSSGAWVCVERFGTVLCHGLGRAICTPALAASIINKTSRPLREAVTWRRGTQQLKGLIDGVEVLAFELGGGATAWLVGGQIDDVPGARQLLSGAVAAAEATPVTDLLVEGLLHPRGMSVPGRAPAAQLLLLRAAHHAGELMAAALVATVGLSARVHTEDDYLVVALPVAAPAGEVLDRVRNRCPSAVAGLSRVASGASDWVGAARIAKACLEAAQRLDLSFGEASNPAVAAEVLLQEASQASTELALQLEADPLGRLREHDQRCSGELVASLRAWCQAGYDISVAAVELGVHTNTLRYRLRRGREISGLDLTQSRQLLALHLLLVATPQQGSIAS